MTTTARPPLTDRQRELLDFIRQHSRLAAPTVREMARAFGIASPNGVQCHLIALERKGYLRRSPNKARSVEVVDE